MAMIIANRVKSKETLNSLRAIATESLGVDLQKLLPPQWSDFLWLPTGMNRGVRAWIGFGSVLDRF